MSPQEVGEHLLDHQLAPTALSVSADTIAVDVAPWPAGQVRRVRSADHSQVAGVIERAAFLPRTTWRAPLHVMAVDGLRTGAWEGWCLDVGGQVVSYADARRRHDHGEIGIVATDGPFRRQDLTRRLVGWVCLRMLDIPVDIGTWQANRRMRTLVQGLGFAEIRRITDRIDGTDTLRYERAAWLGWRHRRAPHVPRPPG